jgi:hypothetical protein
LNWIEAEAKNADSTKDRVVLENPLTVAELDHLLLSKFYPFISEALKKTSLPYHPADDQLKIESKWLGPHLARELTFLLFDHLGQAFLRFSFACSTGGYMFERDFLLGLPETTDPTILFKILSDSRFSGNPPSLHIERSIIHPEWNTYFCITFHAGDGFESGRWGLHSPALADVAQTIENSVELYETSMVEGLKTIEEAQAFLQQASRSFGSE